MSMTYAIAKIGLLQAHLGLSTKGVRVSIFSKQIDLLPKETAKVGAYGTAENTKRMLTLTPKITMVKK